MVESAQGWVGVEGEKVWKAEVNLRLMAEVKVVVNQPWTSHLHECREMTIFSAGRQVVEEVGGCTVLETRSRTIRCLSWHAEKSLHHDGGGGEDGKEGDGDDDDHGNDRARWRPSQCLPRQPP